MVEEGEEAVEDTEEEAFDDIITVVTAARCFSESFKELASASMHSDANSGSEPDLQPEEEDEEQENEEGRQMEELAEEGLLELSLLPSARTFPQLLSLLEGQPEDQGEGSYCGSKPGCSRPEETKVEKSRDSSKNNKVLFLSPLKTYKIETPYMIFSLM